MASPCTSSYYGKRVTPRTRDALWCLNRIMQHNGWEKGDITMTQGSCSTSVGASAGTHAGGDAGDLTKYSQYNRVKYGRFIGFNIHYRTALKNVWSAHIHFTLLKSSTVSSSAQRQNNGWYASYRNGLANNAKATGYLPASREIKFEKKDTSTWVATGKTAGYRQPGKHYKIVNRDVGWTFESLGIVSIGGKKYIFNATPTFYPADDFREWIDDWVKDEETYQVVKPTHGYRKMWSEKWKDTDREPGYIIKSIGHTTKDPIGVATENGVWYRQSDLKKVDNKYSNSNPPDTGTKFVDDFVKENVTYQVIKSTIGYTDPGKVEHPDTRREPGYIIKSVGHTTKGNIYVATINGIYYDESELRRVDDKYDNDNPAPLPDAVDEVDRNIYEITADPSLYGLAEPDYGKPKKVLWKKGTLVTAVVSRIVNDEKWVQNDDGYWFHSHYLKVVGETPEPEVPDESFPIEPFPAEWRVIINGKWGTDGPNGENLYERNAGYHLYTKDKAIVDNVVYYITVHGTWYSAEHLVPWDVPPVPEFPEPTPNDPVVSPTPVEPPKAKETRFKAGTQNIIVRRLGTKPTGSEPFKYGASYSDRADILADEVKKLALSILGTQEAGAYKDRDTLTNALTKATGHKWAGILHGDNGDITQSVHWDTEVWTLRKEGVINSYGSTHNRHTYVRLENRASGEHVWFVSIHLRYGSTMKSHRLKQIKDIVEGAWELAGKEPILFLGDFNNNKKDKDAVTKAMKSNGYSAAGAKFAGLKDTLNSLNTTISKATQIYDNLYWHKSRKIHKAAVNAPISGGKYKKPFISDHNMAWGEFEV